MAERSPASSLARMPMPYRHADEQDPTDPAELEDAFEPVIGEHHVRGYRAGRTAFSVRTNVESFAALFQDRFRDLYGAVPAVTGDDDRSIVAAGDAIRGDAVDDAIHDEVIYDEAIYDEVIYEVVYDVVRTGEGTHPWAVWRDGEPCETAIAENYVLVHLVWEINRLVVDGVGDRLAVHAAAVARNGRALIFPGESHAGKSTLAGWLVAHGWDYVTDELSVIDMTTMWVAPYRRPIGVRPGGPLRPFIVEPPASYAVFGEDEWLVPASTIGPGRLAGSCEVVAIVFPHYEAGADPALTAISGADALVRLAQQAPTRVTGGRATFRQLSTLAQAIPRWGLVFHDLSSVSSLLEPLLEPPLEPLLEL